MHTDQDMKSLQIHNKGPGFLNPSLLHCLHNSQPDTVMKTTKWWFALIFKHFWLWAGQKQYTARSKAALDTKLNRTVFSGCSKTSQTQCTGRLCSERNRNIILKNAEHIRKVRKIFVCMEIPLSRLLLLSFMIQAQTRLSREKKSSEALKKSPGQQEFKTTPRSKCFN